MDSLRRLALLCFTPLLVAGVSSVAQNRISKPLITEKVNENQLVTLKGYTHPAASAGNDRGRVNPSLPMTGMILVLRRNPDQQAAFDTFVASQYDVTSPNYHRWLEPSEVGEKFGPALADIATVSAWLGGHGLSVNEVSKDRMTIRFSGNAAQVQEIFHTEIHNLLVNGEAHISNMTDPQIPMALDQVVLGPKALHNFVPRPLHRTGAAVRLNQRTGKGEQTDGAGANQNRVGANIAFGSGSSLIEDVAPYDFATMYNVLPLWNASTAIDGTGQTIAIAGRSDVRPTDVSKFRSTFGLTGGAFNTIHNGTDPGFCTSTASSALCTLDDQIENALDVEWSGAVAKGATVDLVVTAQTNTNDAIFDSAQYVISNKTASIINVSYGECELFLGTGGNTAYTGLWQTAASQGIAVFVATGDSGAPSCDQGGDSSGTPYSAQYGLSVSGIASTAFNTAVGGTDLNWGATASPDWNATNNSTTGASAAGYIPETPWNDSCTNPLLLSYFQSVASYLNGHGVIVSSPTDAESSCNLVKNHWSQVKTLAGIDISFLVDTVGGSGGASNCTSSDGATVATCTGGYAKPSWQAGVTGILNDNKRDIPDVSFFAGNGLLGSAYVICASDAGTCLPTASTTTEPTGEEIGGTSVASPAMAGVMALINQKAGSAQGNPNSALYVLAGKQTYASCSSETVTAGSSSCYFNDIDTGTIGMPCTAGSPNCTVSTSGDTVGVLSGYGSAVGYDGAAGLGSLNVANVVNSFAASSTGSATPTVSVSASPTTITTSQSTTVTVTVTGTSSTPTGTVFLTSGSFGSATKALASGSVTFALAPGLLAVGADTITATYSGDSIYATAKGTTQVTVTQVSYTLAATAPAAVSRGSAASSTVTVASTNGYVGAVTLTCALTTSPAGATDLPTCAVTGSPVNLSGTATSGTASANVATTAATSASMKKPFVGGWAEAGSGAALALLVFLGIPSRRRGWRAMMGMLVLLFTVGSIAACGGGGSSGGTKDPGTTSGAYVFTVSGTGSPAVSPSPTTTFSVTVN